jgi:hypothetical protein
MMVGLAALVAGVPAPAVAPWVDPATASTGEWTEGFDWSSFYLPPSAEDAPGEPADGGWFIGGVHQPPLARFDTAWVNFVQVADINNGDVLVFVTYSAGALSHDLTSYLVRVTGQRSVEVVAGLEHGDAELAGIDGASFTIDVPEEALRPLTFTRQHFSVVESEIVNSGPDEGPFPIDQMLDWNSRPSFDLAMAVSRLDPLSLCFFWDGAQLDGGSSSDSYDFDTGARNPALAVETMRIALIYLTGLVPPRFDVVDDTFESTVTAYQQAEGLEADGLAGPMTQAAIRADLGCPEPPEPASAPITGLIETGAPDVALAVERWRSGVSSGWSLLDEALTQAGSREPAMRFAGCATMDHGGQLECVWSGAQAFEVISDFDSFTGRTVIAAVRRYGSEPGGQ